MIDFEFEYFPTCSLEEQFITTSIKEAIANLQPEISSFSFFDLNLSDNDYQVLSKIKIQEYKSLSTFSDLHNLQIRTERFLIPFAPENENYFVANYIAELITKLVDNIVAASNYGDAEVVVRAYPSEQNYFPCWHIDKSHDEIITPNNLSYSYIQHVFIFTLQGPSTLFRPLDAQMREDWNKQANQSDYAYGYSSGLYYHIGEGLDGIFNLSKTYTASFNQGSVHFAGYKYGTVHASPYSDEGRFLVLVTPGNTSTIKAIKDFEKNRLQEIIKSYEQMIS